MEWSSYAARLSGHIGGVRGVQFFGFFGAVALGYLIGLYGHWRSLLLLVMPPGLYTMQASADAAGAAAAGWVNRERCSSFVWALPVAAIHVQASLCIICIMVGRKIVLLTHNRMPRTSALLRRTSPYFGIAGGALSVLLVHHWQTRYFLTGLVTLLQGV